MQVTGTHNEAVTSSRTRPAPRQAASDANGHANESAGSRALIPLSPAQASAHTQVVTRQPASFLAHLIATEQSLPQTRERRRIEPKIAIAIYAAVQAKVADDKLNALSRAM